MSRSKWEKISDRAVVPVVLLAIVASYIISNEESTSRDHAQAAQLVKGCVRTSTRSALSAAENFEIAQARKQRGDPHAASLRSEAIGNGFLLTIPAPPGVKQGDPVLAEVAWRRIDGKPVAVLTHGAEALVRRGCEAAYAGH